MNEGTGRRPGHSSTPGGGGVASITPVEVETTTHATLAAGRLRPLLLLPAGSSFDAALSATPHLDLEVRRVRSIPSPMSLDPERPTVLLLDSQLLGSGSGADQRLLVELSATCALLVLGDPGSSEPPVHAPADLACGFIPAGAPPRSMQLQIRGAFRHAAALIAAHRARAEEGRRLDDLSDLARVGVALGAERDLIRLLDLVLSQARRITSSDAGSLYLVDRPQGDAPPTTLRFRLAQNHSLPELPLGEFTVPIDHASLAGYAAATGQPLVIDDVYLLPPEVTYRQNRSFDERFGYRTKSVLIIPMTTHRDEVIGVLQLINRKRDAWAVLKDADAVEAEVLPFDQTAVELVRALAAQAGVAIENSLLYGDIERLFEGFVTASVTAIESRDPITSGHSSRVATLTTGLAEAVIRAGEGPYRGFSLSDGQMRELRYAALLHDFGKVGVREKVLIKQKKLYSGQMELIRHRFAYLLQGADLDFERERADYLMEHGPEHSASTLLRLEEQRLARRETLRRYLDAIMRANEPTVLAEGIFDELREITEHRYQDHEGVERLLLRPEEFRFLSVRRGNLDETERREIESHVTHTFRFLQQIPWTRELRGIPEIALGHHEKLNGRGYPHAREGSAIPAQTRMMTIADIYDALTAADRPYKRAVPTERALQILDMEANEGALDRDLLRTFQEARIWERLSQG